MLHLLNNLGNYDRKIRVVIALIFLFLAIFYPIAVDGVLYFYL